MFGQQILIDEITCAVCGQSTWESIGNRRYERNSESIENEYVKRRLEVLFDVWLPGSDSVVLTSSLCLNCGFVSYVPRPTADEIDAKYRFLTSNETNNERVDATSERERRRATRLWAKCRRRIPSRQCRVLDFGGGDGRLMQPFIEAGHECCVIDYTPDTIAGAKRLGATLDEVSADERFDVIVCSHVIEHVAEPLELLTALRQRLSESGLIYVEVPMEIWRRAPLHEEPVTHVNFFTVESVRVLLSRASFCNLDVRMEGYDHPGGGRAVVVSAFGRVQEGAYENVSTSGAADATRALLNPGVRLRLKRALMDPARLPSTLANRLRRMGRKRTEQ